MGKLTCHPCQPPVSHQWLTTIPPKYQRKRQPVSLSVTFLYGEAYMTCPVSYENRTEKVTDRLTDRCFPCNDAEKAVNQTWLTSD